MQYFPYKIEHIGIAVESLVTSIPLYEKLLGTQCYKKEIVQSENVETAFLQIGDSKIELLEGLEESSVIYRFVEKYGEGIHHIAYAVENINQALENAISNGFLVLGKGIKEGADNKLVAFLHPKDVCGVLTEFCMEKNE